MSSSITNEELITHAEAALNSQNLGDFYVADVGCALISDSGEVFTGACVGGSLSICAEQSAVSALVRKGPPKISKLVAVWKDENGELFAIPPCGRCREFLRIMSHDNLEADIILGKDHTVKLKDLLPYHGWHAEKV
jgi:cytidine deaminase